MTMPMPASATLEIIDDQCKRVIVFDQANFDDAAGIAALLKESSDHDPALFARPEHEVRSAYKSFFVARSEGSVIGCICIHRHFGATGELRSLVVRRGVRGVQLGVRLMRYAIDAARLNGLTELWLDTLNPRYFSRFGFREKARAQMPARMIVRKIGWVFKQPPSRWWGAFTGNFVPMKLE